MKERKKYPKIRALGNRDNEGILDEHPYLTITEKVDGSNTRWWVEDGELHFGTHRAILGTLDQIPAKHLHTQVARLITNTMDADDLNPDYTYFGEKMTERHTVQYKEAPLLLGFDIWMEAEPPDLPEFQGEGTQGRFMRFDVAQKQFQKLGVPTVPLLFAGKSKERWDHDHLRALISDTSYYGGTMEGIAIKDYERVNKWGRPLFAKLVREEFQEKLKTAWGQTKRVGPEQDIVQTYCPDPRIRKAIHRLRDAGEEMSMALMKMVPRMAFDDMMEEHWRDIAYIRQPIEFKVVRNLIAKRSVKVLRRYLAENM